MMIDKTLRQKKPISYTSADLKMISTPHVQTVVDVRIVMTEGVHIAQSMANKYLLLLRQVVENVLAPFPPPIHSPSPEHANDVHLRFAKLRWHQLHNFQQLL